MSAAVMVLVFEAIRKWVSARGGVVVPSWVVPELTVKSPWGVRRSTMAPGTSASWANVDTVACRALRSIGLSADVLAMESGSAVARTPGNAVGAAAVCIARVGTVEHPAIRRAVPTTKLAAWLWPARGHHRDDAITVRT